MTRHSDSLILVWKIAEAEARNLGAVEIEPVHLFLGLLKIVDMSAGFAAEYFEKGRQDTIEASIHDILTLRAAFADASLNSTPVRRRLRAMQGTTPKPTLGRLRRSSNSREVFREAEVASVLVVKPVDLLFAVLSKRLPVLIATLTDAGVSYETLITVTQKAVRANTVAGLRSTIPGRKVNLSALESELRRLRN